MKIAIIGDRGIPARYSGFSTLVEELAIRLVRDFAMEVTVYCRSHYYEEHPPTFKGVRCVYLPAPGGKSFESIIHTNLSIFHAIFQTYDIVFLLDPGNAPFALPLILRRFPLISHTDGLGWMRQKWNCLQQRYYKWSEWVCAKVSDWLVTDSMAMHAYYLSEYQANSSFIPYAGKVGNPPDDSAMEQFGLTKNGYYLIVARLEPENNVHHIIEEYLQSGATHPIVYVGGTPYKSGYARHVFDIVDKNVKCLGPIYKSEVLNCLYQNSYAYIHGHEVGGTNPSLLRAMYAGAACIPIDVIFHREVLSDSALFFRKDPGHLAGIIRSLDRDPEKIQSLGQLCKERSDKLYRWDAIAAAYADLFLAMHTIKKKGLPLQTLIGKDFYCPLEFPRHSPPPVFEKEIITS